MKVLVTGGAGYIGSHTVVQLLLGGHEVTVIDNLCNSRVAVFQRIETICGRRPSFVEGDVRNAGLLRELLGGGGFSAVVHFAGLKAVGDSVAMPLDYYDNNVFGTTVLLGEMARAGVRRMVFSSSATVYGAPDAVPVAEDAPRRPANPYGRGKAMVEDILGDLAVSDPQWRIACLRYFNPVGAHESGLIGEDPQGVPGNLMPYVAQVAIGRRDFLSVFGDDYPTPDGTGIRDYIHVVDLARGHLAALDALERGPGMLTVNLGTGIGHSVLDVVRAFEAACGRPIACRVVDRRPGDVACYYADPALAGKLFGWRAERGLDRMCADHWRWQSMNPEGYR